MAMERCPIHDCQRDDVTLACDFCDADERARRAEGLEGHLTEPGWHPDMPEGMYHADPVPGGSLSASMCKTLILPGGPAKLRARVAEPRRPKPELDLGHAAHRLVLGVGAELERIPHEEWRSKEAKAAVAEARAAGYIPLKPADWSRVHHMAEALAAHSVASRLLAGTAPEVSAFRRHETGTWLRSRFDAVGTDYLVDYKTARSADPEAFRRDAANLGYHVQSAFYAAMSTALEGLPDDPDFYFVVQEKEPPFLVSVVELSPTFLAIGHAAVEYAIDTWNTCLATGVWPGYPDGITPVDPPPWLSQPDPDPLDVPVSTDLDPAFERELARLAGMEIS